MANPYDQLDEEPTVNPYDQLDEEPTVNPYDQLDEQTVVQSSSLEAGTYTQNDLSKNEDLFQPVQKYMRIRYGDQAVDGVEREELVDNFLNSRRGVAAGNSVRGLSEIDFLNSISGDAESMAATGSAYKVYEDMAGIFSDKATWGETAEGTLDFVRSAVLDPLNLVSFGIGKVAAGGGLRIATTEARKAAIKAMSAKALEQGATKKTIQEAGEAAMAQIIQKIGTETATNLTAKAATREILKGQGFKKLYTTSALREIGSSAAFDGAVGTGMEYLYQSGLVRTGVQEDIDKYAVGAAFLGATVMGSIQAGSVLAKGVVDVAMPSITIKPVELNEANALGAMADAIDNYVDNTVTRVDSWKESVSKGQKLQDIDSSFFIDMLIGIGDRQTGEVKLKGLAQIVYESGLTYAKRDADDKYSNWIKDIIKASDPQDIKKFADSWQKASGIKITDADTLTKDQFADIFAAKMNVSGRVLNAASQGAKLNGISVEDYNLQMFVDDALDLGLLPKAEPTSVIGRFADKLPQMATESVRGIQNRIIRAIVSHPATSMLNFVGWGAQTTLGSVSDLGSAILHAGSGTMKKAFGMLEAGQSPLRVSRAIMEANVNRIKLLADPEMTHDAYKSLLALRGDKLKGLSDVLPGGIEQANRVITESSLSPTTQMIGAKADDVIDLVQTLTMVKAQDVFTKSQEFVYQMDKNLRVTFGKSWDEFYTDPDIAKYLNTKEYRQLEEKALNTTLERISSKSYKGSGITGEIAGIIEDARNLPGIGLLVPFGRFFNNTVDFAAQNTPLVPQILKLTSGFYKDKSYSELHAKSLITSAILWSYAESELENRKAGLAINQTVDPITGGIVDVQYDYPLSMYKYAGRIASYWFNGESVPAEVIARAEKDLGLGGLTRNLDQTSKDIVEIINAGLSGEDKAFLRAFEKTGTAIGSQIISGATRPLEPINFITGLVVGSEGKTIDRRQGNEFVNKSLRYLDQIVPLITGEELAPQSTQAAKGPLFIQTSKLVGSRPIRLSATERVMNIMGLEPYTLNAATKVTEKAPYAANKYNAYMFNTIEEGAKNLIRMGFQDMSPKKQRLLWGDMVKEKRDIAKTMLYLDNSSATDTTDLMYQMSDKYSWKQIDTALETMSKNLGEPLEFESLSRGQMYVLQTWLETAETRARLEP